MMTTHTRHLTAAVAAVAALLTVPVQVGAADLASYRGAAAVPTTSDAAGPWQVRVRALAVVPEDEGSVDDIGGSSLSYSNQVIPELDISYFFTDNIAAELILGTTKHGIYGDGSIAGLGKIGSAWLLPPTLTLQYHFTNFGAFKPYVGAGLNYTMFYDEKGASADRLKIDDTFGVALQAGFDYMLDEHWGVNFDVKKIFLRPDFDVTVGGTEHSGKAKLDPWLIGGGITYRF